MTAWTFDALPANLPSGRRYVLWNREPRGKVPYVPTHCTRRASVADPATWDTFAEARASVEDGKADGLGLVLTGDLTVFDLDHCIDPATRLIASEASALLAALPTYTEMSPSDLGLHALLIGTLPPGRRRRAGLECYDRDRFITLTGAHLGTTPPTMIDHTATLTTLYPRLFPTRVPESDTRACTPLTDDDATLLDKAHHARNGVALAVLWTGDTTGYPSASEADAALCRQLAFWTQKDPARIDRLFRQSGLFRTKWDARHGADTYGVRTIAHAIRTTPTVYRPPLNLLELMEVPMADAAD